MWPRRPWVQVPSLTQKISGYSVVRLTRLLWEQEIGSSNLIPIVNEEPGWAILGTNSVTSAHIHAGTQGGSVILNSQIDNIEAEDFLQTNDGGFLKE